MSAPEVKRLGILLFDGVEELDAVGPWEVLSWWTANFSEDGYVATLFSVDGAPVTCAKGMTIAPQHSADDVEPLEVLLHSGGRGTRPQVKDPAHLDRVRAWRRDVPLMTSVCTGSLVYAAAGLLTDRPATTYHGQLDTLAQLDPSIELRREDRYVDSGDVIASAGVSAGIDMAFHLVVRLVGVERARQVRRGIQYDPEPRV
ncbi:DJ-1/PfpI family protein [Actinomycetospora chibensis]|uniref:DJ-1/PfpI family protein n=1 Tax=Actinomycetospora chibensis TaxID=663606 RepID=A0ABV9RI68_9PSEU|nr:DJ-1/PfpI family protein [Actinomycetospora chibensis]MDD7927830.1 DJ-1/PfpI family protein [Actinomycetospora chibensis]